MLKSNLCDNSNVYILVKDDITIIGQNVAQVALKNSAPFTPCGTRIDGTTMDDADDLDLVMSMYKLLEYNSNYSDMTGSLWF